MLGASLDPLIGRDHELDAIRTRVAQHRLVTLTGPGGAGKTRLAREILGREPPDRAAFVEVSPVTEGSQLASWLAVALGLVETADQDAVSAIVAWAAERERLLGLDNVEQVRDARLPVSAILDRAPSLRILATSRVPLGVTGEVEVGVAPLQLPTADTPDAVEASPAGGLFLARCRAIGRLEAMDPPTATLVARLVRRLDGLPLALELAAARTRVLSPGEILRRLEAHDVSLLARSSGDLRHRSLAEVLDWSISLLSPEDRGVLSSIASSTGRFDVALAEALVPGQDVLGALDTLVAYGLIVPEGEHAGAARFRLLETVRAAVADADDPKPRRRHAEEMLRRAERLAGEIEGPDSVEALAGLDADAENLLAAVAWAADADPDLALAIAGAAYPYWSVRGQLRDSVERLMKLLVRAAPDAPWRARAIGGLSRLESELGGHVRALPHGREAARLGRETGDVEAEIEGLQAIVWTSFEAGLLVDDETRRAARVRALEIVAASPPARRFRARQVVLAATVAEVGMAADEVLVELGAAIADAESGGNRLGLAKLRGNRALTHIARAEFAPALADAKTAIVLFRELGDAYHECWARSTAVIASAGLRDVTGFQAALADARRVATIAGSSYGTQDLLTGAAAGAALLGDSASAARLWGTAESVLDESLGTSTTGWILDRARKQLGEVAWAVALDEGHGRDPDEALDGFIATLEAQPSVSPAARPPALRHGVLTRREVEVLRLVAAGKSDGDIAAELFISAKTASVHVSNLKAKLGVATRLEAALRARELGLGD